MPRIVLLLVRFVAPLVPRARRRDWVEQWRADLVHYAQWLDRQGEPRSGLRLVARAVAALPHAIQIRLLQSNPAAIGQDFRFASRLFVRCRAFTGVAVLILALGIGASTTIFGWMQALLFSPLAGVPRQDRLININTTVGSRNGLSLSYPNFQDLRAARLDGVADVMAFRVMPLNLRADGDPQRVFGQLVSTNFFSFLEVEPALGRGFRSDEGLVPDRDAVIVISHELWRRAFASDPAAVGRGVMLNGRPFTIIGVTPPGFRGAAAALSLDVFVPLTLQKTVIAGDRLAQRSTSWLEVYARMADGASLRQVQSSVAVAGARLAEQYPDSNKGRELRAVPLSRSGPSSVLFPVLGTLFGLVTVVLLIACANVAGLLLARAAGREREIAVRVAVGASRGRIVRQLLVENLLLSAAGGLAGLALAQSAAGLLGAFVPRTPFPLDLAVHLDRSAVIFAIALACLTTVVSGLVPAWRVSRPDVGVALKNASPTSVRVRGRLRRTLVVAQIGLSAVLLVCAALFARSLGRAATIDPGFSMRTGFLAAIDLQPAGYDEARGTAFVTRLLDRVGELAPVTGVTAAASMPLDLGGSSDMRVSIDGYTPTPGEDVIAYYNQVAPRYFETMGIAIVRGRAIAPTDAAGRPRVAVINETMARRYFAGRDPVGGTISFGRGLVTIIGVAKDGKYQWLAEAPRSFLYLPVLQNYRADLILHVRSEADPALVLPLVRRVLRELDPNLPLFDVRTVGEHMQIATFLQRIAASMLALFGVLGLLLAAVGLYGVVGFSVAQRTREIGLRVALGASRRQVLALILGDTAIVVGLGIGAGLVLAFVAGRLVASQLTGVSGSDAISFMVTAVILASVAAAASLLPALRAAKLDPVAALRRE